MARINIYVPDALKDKMDKRKDLNWSQIFQNYAEMVLDIPVKDKKPKRDILYLASRRS